MDVVHRNLCNRLHVRTVEAMLQIRCGLKMTNQKLRQSVTIVDSISY